MKEKKDNGARKLIICKQGKEEDDSEARHNEYKKE